MPLHTILRPPTRVSRLYPIMTLALMIGSSSLVYAWQSTQLNSDVAVKDRDRQIEELRTANTSLTAQTKMEQATVQSQKAQIDQKTGELSDIEKQLGDKTQQLKDADDQLTKQKDQLTSNASELASLRGRPPLFSFQNQSSLLNITHKEADVKEVVSAAYAYIQKLYGDPYLLSSIQITFVNTFSIPGASGEIQISNSSKGINIDIHLKDFDKTSFEDVNTVIHEIVHGFHGIVVLDPSVLEEGMAVAATDAVMATMINEGKLPTFDQLYINISEAQYQDYNSRLAVKSDDTLFYQDPLIARVYQLIGKAWFKLYKQDPLFFQKFNEAYYAKVQKGLTVDSAGVRDIIASIVPTVDGLPISPFLQANKAFNPS